MSEVIEFPRPSDEEFMTCGNCEGTEFEITHHLVICAGCGNCCPRSWLAEVDPDEAG